MHKTDFSEQVLQIAGLGVWQVVTGKPMLKRLDPVEDPKWERKSGVFVTIKTGLHVRGSVGLLESSTSLPEALFDAGQSAATHDHRFKPVEENEIEGVGLEVTLINNVKKMTDASQIQAGKHGLIISKGEKRAVLLPQVAFERRWSNIEFLEATCEKAGLAHDDWKDPNTLVEYFDCDIFETVSLYNSIKEFIT